MSAFVRRATIALLALVLIVAIGYLRGMSSLDPSSEAAVTGLVLLSLASLGRRTLPAAETGMPSRPGLAEALRPSRVPQPKEVV